MNHQPAKRILALDVHPRSFGYAAFEGPEKLLDWGGRSFRGGVNAVETPFADRVVALLQEIEPEIVVMKDAPDRIKLNRGKTRKTLARIQRIAEQMRIRTRQFTRSAAKNPFGTGDAFTRQDIAEILAERFPELQQILPPKRKVWQTEDYRMSMFNAVALGVTYFTQVEKRRIKAVSQIPRAA